MWLVKRIKARRESKKKEKEYQTALEPLLAIHSFVSRDTLINSETSFEEYASVASGDVRGSFIGRGTYLRHNAQLPNAFIGRFCSIASNVFLLQSNHPLDRVSTYPGFHRCEQSFILHLNEMEPPALPMTPKGKSVAVGNDVWIGANVTIKGGVTIGDGAVVGANALVTKDVEPYAIVGGVPARLIRYRFPPDQIRFLLEIKWWDWPLEKIKKFAKFFDSPMHLKEALIEAGEYPSDK